MRRWEACTTVAYISAISPLYLPISPCREWKACTAVARPRYSGDIGEI